MLCLFFSLIMPIHINLNGFMNLFKVWLQGSPHHLYISYEDLLFMHTGMEYVRPQVITKYVRKIKQISTGSYRIFGLEKIKCVLFKFEWFGPLINEGVRFKNFGVVDVNFGRRYNIFKIFILASQTDKLASFRTFGSKILE